MTDTPKTHTPKECPYCQAALTLTTGAVIYPQRHDLANKPFWACLPCKAWVGCHPGTTKRLGRVANAQHRMLKLKAHEAFDQLWTSGQMTRGQAYAWLREQMGLSKRDCHIGWMDEAQCRRVVEVVNGR